ncbi:hypothetical protein CSA37_11000 [Candidatus Fermentibacteria bacterium]|nr:MAG: hypothetical protein CSA37_11000 [Candidatus Fermentibacteria bacterium]
MNPGKLIRLSLTESLFVIAWGALGGALLMPFTVLWYLGTVPALITTAWVLAGIELKGHTGPLQAYEVRQYSSDGRRKVSKIRTFFRILLTSILFPALMINCLPLLFEKRSMPEIFSGTKLTVVDRRLDPRPEKEIEARRKAAVNRSRILIIVPLAAAAAVFIMKHSVPEAVNLPAAETEYSLPEHERELLSHYLEMTTIHPEELEYHVRLASLFYRNGMEDDLIHQLEIIEEIDPDHAILILGEPEEFCFEELIPEEDTLAMEEVTVVTIETEPAAEDSSASDSTNAAAADSLVASADTATVSEPDTLVIPSTDLQTDTLPSDTIPASEPPPDIQEEPAEPQVEPEEYNSEPEEEAVSEPDTLVQS